MPRTEESLSEDAAPQTILVVDDDPRCTSALARALRGVPGSDPCVLTACGAEEATAVAIREPIDVAISDYHMAGRSGLAFFKWLRAFRPTAKRILLTGDSDSTIVRNAFERGDTDLVLGKPYSLEGIRKVLE